MPNKLVDAYNHVRGAKGFDYDQISDTVFIGSNMCCQFGFDKELLAKGVRADISLEKERIDTPVGVDYFLWLPTEDMHAPTQDALLMGVQALEFFAHGNIKVFIHCKNGHGRAPTLYCAFLMSTGMDLESAVAALKARRPSVHINDLQLKALETFQHSCQVESRKNRR